MTSREELPPGWYCPTCGRAPAQNETAGHLRPRGEVTQTNATQPVTSPNLADVAQSSRERQLYAALKIARQYMDCCLGSPNYLGPNPYPIIDAALGSSAATQPPPNVNDILADIVACWNDLKRDEGAFPTGDRRAAMSEHRLWHAIQIAKGWLSSIPSTERAFPTDPNDPRYKMVGMGETVTSTGRRAPDVAEITRIIASNNDCDKECAKSPEGCGCAKAAAVAIAALSL
jgi:hypothetical protein